MNTVRVIIGDCLDSLRALPDGAVQCCVTSPPYYGLRDYGMAGQIGLEESPDAYVARLVEVFREVRRVLRDDGVLWLNLGDSYAANGTSGLHTQSDSSTLGPARDGLPGNQNWKAGTARKKAVPTGTKPKDLLMIPAQVALALRADGWWLRADIIWHKPNPMPESVTDRPTSAHEHVFLLTKSARYFYDADAIREEQSTTTLEKFAANPTQTRNAGRYSDGSGREDGGYKGSSRNVNPDGARNARNVWTIATQPYSGAHFATMPPELAERCIKAGSSEKGQCPHCGSPWVRQVETARTKDPTRHTGRAKVGCEDRQDADTPRMLVTTTTTGWAQTCDCPEHRAIPQTILDPFGGAGTTGLVADRLNRSAILCELNPAYAALARDRVRDDAPLLAAMA